MTVYLTWKIPPSTFPKMDLSIPGLDHCKGFEQGSGPLVCVWTSPEPSSKNDLSFFRSNHISCRLHGGHQTSILASTNSHNLTTVFLHTYPLITNSSYGQNEPVFSLSTQNQWETLFYLQTLAEAPHFSWNSSMPSWLVYLQPNLKAHLKCTHHLWGMDVMAYCSFCRFAFPLFDISLRTWNRWQGLWAGKLCG